MTAWIEQWHHDIVAVSRLPLPEEIERPACMTGRILPGVRRRVRQLAPRPALRDCCDYHGQDWARASETAIRLLEQAKAEGIDGEPAGERVVELAEAEGISQTNGRHRIQAMIDQGVRRTVLLRLVLLDPTTGLPA